VVGPFCEKFSSIYDDPAGQLPRIYAIWIDFHISIQNCQRSLYEVFWLNSILGM